MTYLNSKKDWNLDLTLKIHRDHQARLQSHRKFVRVLIIWALFKFYYDQLIW